MLTAILRQFGRLVLRLRYRIEVRGLAEIAERGTAGILFLPNHPALIDPVIVLTELHHRFTPHSLADKDQVDRPLIRWLARRFGARPMPDPIRYGESCHDEVEAAIAACIAGLKKGENLLLYPAGRIYRRYLEDLGGNSSAERILQEVPNLRVVLIRTRGLWGSMFSRASGRPPSFGQNIRRCLWFLPLNIIFFAPRRPVSIELYEATDIPRDGDRAMLNRYLESFYNEGALPHTYVPYTIWEKGSRRTLPEPTNRQFKGNVEGIPPATRQIVLRHLAEITGRSDIREEDELARDLSLDSLERTELAVWLESEFGLPVGDSESLVSVRDALLAACGQGGSTGTVPLKKIPAKWFKTGGDRQSVFVPAGDTITAVFLQQARRAPGSVILADQNRGVLTYRDMVMAIHVLKREIASLEGKYIGIMLPASSTAAVIWLSVMFAGKIPVMVNWTVGPRNLTHSLELLGVRQVLSSRLLVEKLAAQGINLNDLADRLLPLEDLGQRISLYRKLQAWLAARLGNRSLERAPVAEVAVVLFTSGSESLPKAVPLTHANILANTRDVVTTFPIDSSDRLVAMLPPFHSFGLTGTVAMPLCGAVPVIYHPNPMDGGRLAQLIEAYRASLLVGTPTFLANIVRAAEDHQLASLRLVISGAEKCPAPLYETLAHRWPNLVLVEGYGITECSPVVSANDPRSPRPGTIGRVLPSVRAAIVDVESGHRVGLGQPGMLLVQGPSIFRGYLNYEGSSPFVEFEGAQWYRTGDLVSADGEGILTFIGRLKRFVKLGGEMISLPAIEDVLAKDFTNETDEGPVLAVESTPSESSPEIVLFTTRPIDRVEANQKIRKAGLSPLHNIRQVIQLEQIPTLGTGKTDYRALKERLK